MQFVFKIIIYDKFDSISVCNKRILLITTDVYNFNGCELYVEDIANTLCCTGEINNNILMIINNNSIPL